MAFKDFTLDSVQQKLGVKLSLSHLFPALRPVSIPEWLPQMLGKTRQYALVSEKSRGEFIVAPILIAVREISDDSVAILSGLRLDIDAATGLDGECDFIFVPETPLPILRNPLLIILQANSNDIETALGQCAAQMVAARTFNEKSGVAGQMVFGCVTTGEAWQFLRLTETSLAVNHDRLYLGNLGSIMAALLRAVGHPATL